MVPAAIVVLLFTAIPALATTDTDVPRITREELKSLLGNRNLVIFFHTTSVAWTRIACYIY